MSNTSPSPPPAPFGLILPSRPFLPLEKLPISDTQFACRFPSNPHFSHIVAFLLPGNLIPLNHGAAVYIQFPGSSEFKLLGAIGNEKQSAIFKINGYNGASNGMANGVVEVDMDADVNQAPAGNTNPPGEFVVGISIEPAVSIAAQLASMKAAPSEETSTALTIARRPPSTKILAQRIIKNAFNFLASFAEGAGGTETVPLKAFQEWWAKFERRVENDPGFLERDADG
ncbi:hypothetical protein MMC30_009150 [Trapelia coarctata]|nr:hypothetical protein [Trapelia coarctata]